MKKGKQCKNVLLLDDKVTAKAPLKAVVIQITRPNVRGPGRCRPASVMGANPTGQHQPAAAASYHFSHLSLAMFYGQKSKE